MPSCANAQSTDNGSHDYQNATPPTDESPSKPEEEEDEDEEDEDVDFNPFLKGTPSPEASSSLSSEIEDLDGDVVGIRGNNYDTMGIHSLKLPSKVQKCDAGDPAHREEKIVMQINVSSEGTCEKELRTTGHRKHKRKIYLSVSQAEIDNSREKENGLSCGIDVNDDVERELSNTTQSQKPMNLDDEDAICMRTRARYSLASFTLDELEAFLQETDDEGDLQNVDDEEEYKKFLAAVLQGGDGDGESAQENDNGDDEDEDTDADFEIELEEALESDYDEDTANKTRTGEYERAGQRPETRQNRQQKAPAQCKKMLLEQPKRLLRPLRPILPNGQIAPIPTLDGRTLAPVTAPTGEDGLINGFTPHQIGQLHCLIHEHVQLLIQIFSLCVLDPSRQHIKSQVQGLISEMLHKHEEVIACRSEPHPGFCFRPPYICSSVPDEVSQIFPAQCMSESSSRFDALEVCSPNTQMPTSQNNSPYDGRYKHNSIRQVGYFQTVGGWMPFVSGPVISVLDVAPLNLVGRYMEGVFTAVQEYRRRHVESSCDTFYEREPLFPLPHFPSLAEANSEVLRGRTLPAANKVPSSSSQQQRRKTLAATLVESSKKQSVALVPKEIAKLAQRFFPLFNPSLYPHKPPAAAVANRVLFTDAEDELLALGLMEYNSDWKAIQLRFLPCKSKHQIFVRQKNRCSSKAPENPIKAVRRMKTSPLTAEEIACIQEGLKVFKLDWMSVWKFVVPHRDPSLLPRQWRTALGTQRSYKLDAAQKEKRRLYESKRRCKTASANWQLASDKEDYQAEITGAENYSGDDNAENAGEAYVHEAFLADWRPGISNLISSEPPCFNHREKDLPNDATAGEGTAIREPPDNYESGRAQLPTGNMHRFPYGLNCSQQPSSYFSHGRQFGSITMQTNHPVSNMSSSTRKPQIYLRPYRARRSNNPRVVRLAPDLPPVNLPPSVRVISQSAFQSNQLGASTKSSGAEGSIRDAGRENIVPRLPHVSGAIQSIKTRGDKNNPLKDKVTNSNQEEPGVARERCLAEETGTDSDLQMHPLLFQAPEDGRLPYYPLNCTTGISSSFSFFSENRPQLNLSLFHKPNQTNHVDGLNKALKTKEFNAASGGIDFHPLMQRIDDANSNMLTAHQSAGLEGISNQLHNHSDAGKIKSPVSGGPFASSSKPSSPNQRANEVDLEINLSSRSIKEKAIRNRDITAYPTSPIVILPGYTNTMETSNIYSPSHQHSESNPAVCSKVVSGVNGSVALSNNISRCNTDDIGDQSHQEIVMEQEELSDSDEEIEEHVEFEREEMADSEGEEGSRCEQIAEMQDKEIPSPVAEIVGTDTDSDDEQRELGNSRHPQVNVSVPRKDSPPFLRLSLTDLGKESTSNSWLSLDSCAPGRPLCMRTKHEYNKTSKGSTTRNLVSCRPSRSCKKTTSTKKVVAQKHVLDMAQQLSLGPLAVQTLKKPRKRASRANASLNVGVTLESSRSDGEDKFG